MKMDVVIKALWQGCLKADTIWITEGCGQVLRINESRPHSPYSFEWFVQTTFAAYLLSQKSYPLSSIRIGLKSLNDETKPDISFVHEGVSVVIQVKTVGKTTEKAYQQGDLVKKYNADCAYLLVVCYPNGFQDSREPDSIYATVGPCRSDNRKLIRKRG